MEATPNSTESDRERALAERNDQLRDLIRAISHDLRTPLSVAEGNVELARETGDLSRLESTEQALDRASELLDHLALLAEEGKRIREPKPTGVREVAEAAWSVVGTEEATLAAEVDLVVSADRQRFQQLLENLFGNAVEHSSTGSRTQSGDVAEGTSASNQRPPDADDAIEHAGPDVTVTVGPLDEKEGFFVEDDGPGIPEGERTEVFGAGYSYESEGRGHGLAICERIATAHGWEIEAVGPADGGARFEVSSVEVV